MASGTVPGTFPTVQNAINQAVPGDIITVAHTYVGNEFIVLPGKSNPSNLYITIQSDALASLPAGTRVKPSDNVNMPKIQGDPTQSPSVSGQSGSFQMQSVMIGYNRPGDPAPANYYKFIGIEFNCGSGVLDGTVLAVDIIRLDGNIGDTGFDGNQTSSNALSQLSHHFIFDRCYIHCNDNQIVQTGMWLNCGACTVTESYVAGAKTPQGGTNNSSGKESHGIWMLNGPGPFNFNNSYIDGQTQTVFSGGSWQNLPEYIGDTGLPSGTFTGCTIAKDFRLNLAARAANAPIPGGGSYIAPPAGTTQWFEKNIFELKNGINWTISGNLFQYGAGQGGQNGEAFVINLANYNAAIPKAYNIKFINNIIDSVGGVFTINYVPTDGGGIAGGGTDPIPDDVAHWMHDITIQNNLVTNFAWRYCGTLEKQNCDLRMIGKYINLIYDHNTIIPDTLPNFQSDASITWANYNSNVGSSTSSPPTLTGFKFTNNVCAEQFNGWQTVANSGTSTTDDSSVLKSGGWIDSTSLIKGNIAWGQSRAGTNFTTSSIFPTSGITPPSAQSGAVSAGASVTLTNVTRNGGSFTYATYPPLSQFNGTATDGTAPGVNYSALPGAGGATPPFSTNTSINNNTAIQINQGSNATVNVQVSSANGTPTGPVTLILNPGGSQQTFGPVNLTSGQATFSSPTFTTSGLAAGTYNLAANYAGVSGQWLASSGTGTLKVVGVQAAPTITITPTTVTWPTNLPIAITVSPPSGQTLIPTGTVTLSIDSVNIGQITLNTAGQAWFIVPGLNAGTRNLSIMYSGDSTYPGVTTPGTAVISPAACTMTVQGPPSINSGQNAAYTVTVTSP